MSASLSSWLTEGVEPSTLAASGDVVIQSDAAGDGYNAYSRSYIDYYNYSNYYNYYNYYDYYNYSNYSNSIRVIAHPISQIVSRFEIARFSVSASNTIDSCQWYSATSATGAGTAIPGATSPIYTVVATEDLDGRYYYCVVRRGGNSATSSRALLTVKLLDVYDIYVAVGGYVQTVFVRTNPKETTIASVSVEDSSIATVDATTGRVTGVSKGITQCTITGSHGLSNTFTIYVIEDDLIAVLENLAVAIREYKNVSYRIYPNQMVEVLLSNNLTSRSYNTIGALFSDIAASIRSLSSKSDRLNPHDFYKEILSLI